MDLYKILGVDRNASSSEIRKAYLKLTKTAHPDKGGDEEEFKKITKAHEILSNEESKQFYDQTGQIPGENGAPNADEGHPMGGFPGGFPFDLGGMFGHMFGGGFPGGFPGGPSGQGPRPRQRRGEKAPPKVEHIPVSLRQLYGGYTISFSFNRQKFCVDCKGTGAKTKETCGNCNGRGVQDRVMQMGPGMMVHTTGPCGKCNGSGEQTKETCGTCTSSGRVQEKKDINARIEPGMAEGDSIIFEGACSDTPDFDKAGDIHIILKNADDTHGWVRKGNDLENTITITYREALIGATIKVEGHPRADELFIDIPAATITGDVLTIVGEGMPIKNNKNGKGDMRLTIKVCPTDSEREMIRASDVQLADIFNYKKSSQSFPENLHLKSVTLTKI
jgi:DnaJ-class molecular chaperone